MKSKTEIFHILRGLILLFLACLLPVHTRAESVVDSPHNLGAGGSGPVKATTATGVCIFCHTPHGGVPQTPLWSHHSSTAAYTPYSSSTMIANVGQPNGASALCLGCHDGTIALGMINNSRKPISMQGGVTVMPAGANNLGTDLSQDHPISFVYNSALSASDGQLADPSTLNGPVKLDHSSQLQCTACHDPHNDQYGNFLVMDNSASALCTTCHLNSSWSGSAHRLSSLPLKNVASQLSSRRAAPAKNAALQLVKQSGAKTVGANACNNCHTSHKAAGRQQLLLTARQEQTCFACHNGSVVRQNIEAEFNKLSVHPVLQSMQTNSRRASGLTASSEVTCSDCHNSHAAKNSIAAAPNAAGSILGVKGVTSSGAVTGSIKYEYELCFRCHGDRAVRVQSAVARLVPQANTRLAFIATNRSYHPVVERGKSPRVPSLIAPYTTTSLIKCTDCHNNNQGPGAGGTGPRGPHGSAFAPLLERQLITVDFMGESAVNYALCYKCHNRGSILSDQSFRGFNSLGQDRGHRYHIVDQQTACTTCHDSHGVTINKHLINFNPEYVTAGSNGQITYNSTGSFRGNCTLTCHGFNHLQSAYPTLTIHPVSAAKVARKPAAPRLREVPVSKPLF